MKNSKIEFFGLCAHGYTCVLYTSILIVKTPVLWEITPCR